MSRLPSPSPGTARVLAVRPVIGITCYVEPIDRAGWIGAPSSVLPQTYVESVQAAGGLALVIPPRLDCDDALAAELLEHVDALVLVGGADVEPSRYGAQPHPSVQAGRPDRDTSELALARMSAASGIPTLGICRGMQVMAVAAGGTLIQHLPDVVGSDEHAVAVATFNNHPVAVVQGTRLAGILGESVTVPSHHHQAVATHPGYVAAAYAPDGTLEAMEDPAQPWRLAVQWHPEAGTDLRLFEALVTAASASVTQPPG